jgi:SAM-dependent methyltransferase
MSMTDGWPLDSDATAKAIQGDPRATTILLDALAALGLLVKQDDKYSSAPGTTEFLAAGGKSSMLAMAQHQANCLRNWAQLARVAKTGKPARREPSVRGEAADYAAFIEAMDNVSRTIAPRLVAQLPELEFSHLLDVGGASGTWTISFLERYPNAKATLFDLPKVIPQATTRLTAANMLARVRLVGGDFTCDPLPPGADLAWVSAIIHQMSREDNRKLFRSVFAALNPGGQILIRDHVMDSTRTKPVAGALFAINMLVNTETGATFTFDEICEDLKSAGFAAPELLRMEDTMHCVIRARKSE